MQWSEARLMQPEFVAAWPKHAVSDWRLTALEQLLTTKGDLGAIR